MKAATQKVDIHLAQQLRRALKIVQWRYHMQQRHLGDEKTCKRPGCKEARAALADYDEAMKQVAEK